jgi:WD40 repeat protein
LAVAHSTTPFITIYKRSGDVFTKLYDPIGGLPAGTGNGSSFSPDGSYLAVAHSTSPYLKIYKTDKENIIQLISAKNQFYSHIPPAWKFGLALETKADGELISVNTFPKFNNLPLF